MPQLWDKPRNIRVLHVKNNVMAFYITCLPKQLVCTSSRPLSKPRHLLSLPQPSQMLFPDVVARVNDATRMIPQWTCPMNLDVLTLLILPILFSIPFLLFSLLPDFGGKHNELHISIKNERVDMMSMIPQMAKEGDKCFISRDGGSSFSSMTEAPFFLPSLAASYHILSKMPPSKQCDIIMWTFLCKHFSLILIFTTIYNS